MFCIYTQWNQRNAGNLKHECNVEVESNITLTFGNFWMFDNFREVRVSGWTIDNIV